jgi:hypothetical protein
MLTFQRQYSLSGRLLCRVCGSSPRCLIVDGNMKLRHQKQRGRGTSVRDVPSFGSIVGVGEPLYILMMQLLARLSKSRHATCSNFTADCRAISKKVDFNVSGVFLAVCRHRVV